jgi:hypothetical protein
LGVKPPFPEEEAKPDDETKGLRAPALLLKAARYKGNTVVDLISSMLRSAVTL